jgi:hypothetical protein
MIVCPIMASSKSEKKGPYLLRADVLKNRGTRTFVAVASPLEKPSATRSCLATRRGRPEEARCVKINKYIAQENHVMTWRAKNG